MGRTVSPFSAVFEGEIDRFSKLRRALRKEDQERFDRVFNLAHQNIHAGVQQSDADPFETILVLVLVGLMKRIDEMEKGAGGQPTLFSE